jgi:hypothetical protein
MEPVTYLAGLSTIMCGYLWFLYHNREVSYRSALNITVSRRQNTLYEKKGFDLQKWETLIDEANALRREIKGVANEYDVSLLCTRSCDLLGLEDRLSQVWTSANEYLILRLNGMR